MRLTGFLTLLVAIVFAMASCDRDENPVMSSDPTAPSISSENFEGQSFSLTEDNADEELLSLEWSAADFGYDAAIEYEVQLAELDDEDFEAAAELVSTRETEATITVGQLNDELISMGLPDGVEADLHVRVLAEVDGAEASEVVTDPIPFTATPYLVQIEYPELQVPGGYQGASNYGNDWSPDDEDIARLYSFDDDDNYEGYVYIDEDSDALMFKFTQGASWDNNWGDDDVDGTLDPDGADIEADPGYYRMTVDMDAMEYETTQMEWGIIGEAANGWGDDDDIMMEYDMEEHVWTADVTLDEGPMKFRANQSWDYRDYGDDEGNFQVDAGGADIEVEEAGDYTVILNLHEPDFSYELIQN